MANKRKKKNQYKKEQAGDRTPLRRRLAAAGAVSGFVLVLVLVAFVCMFVYDFFTQSPYFAAKKIEVTGMSRLTREEVLKQARVEEGTNILGVSLEVTRERLLTHPWIWDAEVSRDLPDRFSIHITEREAVAVLDLGDRFLMDRKGEIFKRQTAGDPEGLPLVLGLTFPDIAVAGEPMEQPFKCLVEFFRDRKDRDGILPDRAISAIYVDRDMGLTLVAFDPPVAVRIGFDGFAQKIHRLGQVLNAINGQEGLRAATIDILDKDRVVVRPIKIDKGKSGTIRKNV